MRRSKFSRDEIKAILTEQEDGESVAEISARHGISRATFYNWKSKYQPKFASTRRLNLEEIRALRMSERPTVDWSPSAALFGITRVTRSLP